MEDLSFLLMPPPESEPEPDSNPFPEGTEAHDTIAFWLAEAARLELNSENIPAALAASMVAANRVAIADAIAAPATFSKVCEHVRAQADAERRTALRKLTPDEQAELERRHLAREAKKAGME